MWRFLWNLPTWMADLVLSSPLPTPDEVDTSWITRVLGFFQSTNHSPIMALIEQCLHFLASLEEKYLQKSVCFSVRLRLILMLLTGVYGWYYFCFLWDNLVFGNFSGLSSSINNNIVYLSYSSVFEEFLRTPHWCHKATFTQAGDPCATDKRTKQWPGRSMVTLTQKILFLWNLNHQNCIF